MFETSCGLVSTASGYTNSTRYGLELSVHVAYGKVPSVVVFFSLVNALALIRCRIGVND